MPDYPLWWAKKRGCEDKTLEQVALTDYPYLVWSEENIRGLDDRYREEISGIRQRLNNYIPVMTCKRCNQPATRLSILHHQDTMMHEWVVRGDHFYCGSADCTPADDSRYSEFVLLPLRFDSILGIRYSRAAPRDFFKDLHEAFRRSAGWTDGKKVTARAAREFLEQLALTKV